MYEYGDPSPGEYQIGLARQIMRMQAVAVTRSVQESPQLKFGLGVSHTNSSHHARANGRRNYVHHTSCLSLSD